MRASARQSRRASPPKYARYQRQAVARLCWGLLLQMLGKDDRARPFLSQLKRGKGEKAHADEPLRRVAGALLVYQRAEGPGKRSEAHKDVVRALGDVLHPEGSVQTGPQLHREPARCQEQRQATDGPRLGYSRDPFKRIAKNDKPEVALAAASYLARAYSFFFHRPPAERSFNSAKVSLNDLFQASQLACRLYYSLEERHDPDKLQEAYLRRVREGPGAFEEPPWGSPFFASSLLDLVEIQRANIYRQLQYLQEADRFYRHAQARFGRLVREPLAVDHEQIVPVEKGSPSSDEWFLTPTLVRMLSERSKVLFDRGLFIDSMMCQVRCLAYLFRMASGEKRSWSELREGRRHDLLSEIARGLRFLDITRRESVWDKDVIQGLFKEDVAESFSPLRVLFAEDFLAGFLALDPKLRELVADLYARLGLILFIFKSTLQRAALPTLIEDFDKAGEPDPRETKLQRFVTVNETLGVQPSEIVLDARGILSRQADHLDGLEEAQASLERSLARSLRRGLPEDADAGRRPARDEKEFLEAVLEVATRNILNIVTIPRRVQSFLIRPGYKERRAIGDLSGTTVADAVKKPTNERPQGSHGARGRLRDKLVVLRRWQSYNPKVPRPRGEAVRGGGYFLMWSGKGIVIDPGYDFLQNFYDEGFSLGDIDAVVVTHTHPDHEDDLSTLSTLVREWNEYHQHMGRYERRVKLDVLLNESAHLKFSNWLKASEFGIGRIIPLPLVVWNLRSEDPGEAVRGGNVLLPLRKSYRFDLEVVPAWHDDVIGKTAAVGLKFHLYADERSNRKLGVVGFTGDTGAYGPSETDEAVRPDGTRIEDHFKDCDVLVAHLGDVRLRELFSSIDPPENDPQLAVQVGDLLKRTFCDGDHASRSKLGRDKVEDFFSLLVTLNIAPRRALERIVDGSRTPPVTVARALNSYIQGAPLSLRGFSTLQEAETAIKDLCSVYDSLRITQRCSSYVLEAGPPGRRGARNVPLDDWQIAYILLGFLCEASLDIWHYPYHLGITGLYRLHRALVESCARPQPSDASAGGKIMVVGELPEELASYRHYVARLLNFTQGNFNEEGKRLVHTFTGDIGLHIGLDAVNRRRRRKALKPTVRCTYCNYNNETVLEPRNYHPPDQILETPLKRVDSAMIYLCTAHDHHPEAEERPYDFLSRPFLRVI